MNNNTVTFFTNCYERDWETIIVNGGFERKIENLNYNFFKKKLIITNVENRKLVEDELIKIKEKKIIDEYYFTDDSSKEVLNYFNINENTFNGGYWYSISPLTSIYKCDTDYLLYLTADSLVEKKDWNWIDNGIEMMKLNKKIKAVNPIWNLNHSEAQSQEKFYIDNGFSTEGNNLDWYYTLSFSDQCFLIKTEEFKKQIYNEKDELSELFYPGYAGDSFEKRVSSYLKNNRFYLLTNKHVTYFHPRWY
jgi:hypothetical protein